MDKNTCREFNIQFYEQHLSLFGKKVLQVLVKQWNTRNDRIQYEQHRKQLPIVQNRKVLTFNDCHAIHPTSTPLNNGYTFESEKSSVKFNFTENILSSIPTSVQLIETVEIKELNDSNKYDQPLRHRLSGQILINEPLNNKDSEQIHLAHTASNNTNDKTKDVNWGDMFDTDLFPIIKTNVKLNKNSYLRNENSEIRMTGQNNYYNNNSDRDLGPMNLKRKNLSKITNAILKKDKLIKQDEEVLLQNIENQTKNSETKQIIKDLEVKITKHNFRKQKYTKSIKNWLNDVNQNNIVEDKILCGDSFQQEVNNTADKAKTKISTKAKKVVQAQLSNKDGVMKYSKPKITKEPTNIENVFVMADKVTLKEKKIKTFRAPIKSQISVKDIGFQVRKMDSNNEKEYHELFQIKNKEIYVTLLFRNGFSQFNSHYTDDSCVPEAIIVNYDEVFYCLNGNPGFKEIINHLLETNIIICYDGKPILVYLASELKIEMNTSRIYDAQIGGSLLDPDNPPENFSELQKLLVYTPPYTIATECKLQKAAWYITMFKECWKQLANQLMENSLWSVFVGIETRILPIVANMELRGVNIDLDKLRSMEEVLLTKIKQVEQECYKAAGKVFQINSTLQVRAIIYDELQLDTKCNVQIRETICKGAKSTSETMLRSLVSVHALPKLILEYRRLHKAYATFLAGIGQHVKDGVVRPTWVQTAAATGRIASNNPNLQAIPKVPFNLVTLSNTENTDHQELNFRSVYTSREGYSLLAADFKHVECRVFAHAAADTGLLDILKSSEDLFRVLAAKWLNKPEADVSREDRERTKRIVYASLYGAGTRKLIDILDVSYEQALAVSSSFNRTFPSLKSFGRRVVSRCEGEGRLRTLCGRTRRLQHIASEDLALRSHAERQAVNFVIQGSAADLCKTAMILTEERLRTSLPPVHAHLILQLHDELVWEVEHHDLDRAADLIKRVMENCGRECGMAITLPVAVSTGTCWGQMAPLALD